MNMLIKCLFCVGCIFVGQSIDTLLLNQLTSIPGFGMFLAGMAYMMVRVPTVPL